MESKIELEIKFFCINVYKNGKEKLSLGFWVTKIKTDTAGALFPNSWCNQPAPPQSLTGLRKFPLWWNCNYSNKFQVQVYDLEMTWTQG